MHVFVTGGTGYIGRHLIAKLIARGHRVAALTRPTSASKLVPSCRVVFGDALDATSYMQQIGGADTLVHLVGVAHPGPGKVEQFQTIDFASARAALTAAGESAVQHFVYLSVAQPAPVMHAYVAARAKAEAMIRASGIAASILRPWYVLGPGHRWPLLLLPAYALCERLPGTREAAQRLGLVNLEQMAIALLRSIEHPPPGVRVWEVPEIRAANG
ncbi:MAG TPA: NAD(P)H-binding protein [Accumulibacter sp.]|uniref:SDR family oxidoreductase n=1 Tax=Accumulibacter sp. TaxID=2053492 RepID=UPI0025F6D1F7|nr:NAD(P)H-binding protein [Accumulibacter sp.]MCM8599835.1 NAD(P)H-binding protein [Accumulibacter sp.]MCM8662722.1 NAD(P)H-binding protein [Accumulibacter sp.]HNC52911.1 NAD(P)H-binding protein [Accumulibacter sp.]